MKLEQQVVSLELAHKLKELGVKQESHFYWWNANRGALGKSWELSTYTPTKATADDECYSAFTVAELGEMLPDFYNTYWCHSTYNERQGGSGLKHWECVYEGDDAPPYTKADTEADARAKMLIYLLENKLIEAA